MKKVNYTISIVVTPYTTPQIKEKEIIFFSNITGRDYFVLGTMKCI